MRTALVLIALVLIVTVGAIAGGLVRNEPPWSDPPGFDKRLATYLGTHIAETAESSEFPELRRRHYPGTSPDRLFAAVEEAARKMPNWEVSERNAAQRSLRAVVTTPLLHFHDDMSIAVLPDPQSPAHGSVLHLSSQSRVGQGDLAANTRHILDFYHVLDEVIPPPGPAATTASH